LPGHAYEHIAGELQAQILSGHLPPGAHLPSHADLARHYEVSEIVVRRAVQLLKDRGLLETRGRGGTYVRERPLIRRISSERYRADFFPKTPGALETSFTRDQGIRWEEYRLDKAFRWIDADERLAELFGVEAGTRVLERNFVFFAAGTPSQMSRSCLLAADVEGTPVADPHNEPWPGGNVGQLRSLGIDLIPEVDEAIATRMPTDEETRILRVGPGIPVFAVTRRMFERGPDGGRGRVAEVADPIVLPGDRVVLEYRVKVQ
jgi:GntR family transcriptional regulator